MTAPVAAQRILKGVAANLDVQFLDQEGEPVNPAGAITVDVTRGDGTAIATGASATTIAGTPNTYRYSLSMANNDRLDLLTLTWREGGVTRRTTQAEVVGGFYFTVAELRAFDAKITTALIDDPGVRRIRAEAERAAERITGTAWVPRYRRMNYSIDSGLPQRQWGWNTKLVLENWNPRTIRSVRVYSDAVNYTALTTTELSSIVLREWGTVERADVGAWLSTYGGTVIEYEHGYDAPPPDIKHAAMTHARYLAYREKTGIPDRATTYSPAEGGYFQIATPGAGWFRTGLPDVDAVYLDPEYCKRLPGSA